MAESLAEARYLLASALRTRQWHVIEENRYTFAADMPYAHFKLSFMPGNRRVLISHGVEVEPEMRGKGFGRKLLAFRETVAREAGCNLMLATVRNDNAIENHLLETSGWNRLIERETGVTLWGKRL